MTHDHEALRDALEEFQKIDGYHKEAIVDLLTDFGTFLLGRPDLIHRSKISEETARAGEWQTIQNCPSDGRLILVFGGQYTMTTPNAADGDWWRTSTARGLGAAPTHWMPLPSPPALTLTEEAGHAER